VSTLSLSAIALAVAALVGASGGYKLTRMHYEHVADVAARAAAAEVAAANDRTFAAANSYEQFKAAQRPRVVTVTREIEREIKSDTDCADHPLPVGLRDALAAAASADANQPRVDGPVPAASAAGLGDLGGLGARLFGRPRGTP
jgi:hypothetical protein